MVIKELAIGPFFDNLTSGAELPGKPDPATFLLAAGRVGVPPARCLVIEDAVAGVEAARRAGMRCLAVTTTNPAEKLQAADRVVERLDQITEDEMQALLVE